jgi:hypothetical protein
MARGRRSAVEELCNPLINWLVLWQRRKTGQPYLRRAVEYPETSSWEKVHQVMRIY